MFCPNCGTTVSREQKYCRNCGLALEKVVSAVSEQLPLAGPSSATSRHGKMTRAGQIMLALMITILFGSIIGFGVIYEMIIKEGKILPGVFLLLFFITGFSALALLVWPEIVSRGSRIKPTSSETKRSLAAGAPSIVAPTITERTTDFLHTALEGRSRNEDQCSEQ